MEHHKNTSLNHVTLDRQISALIFNPIEVLIKFSDRCGGI